jgi:hypothetical protein
MVAYIYGKPEHALEQVMKSNDDLWPGITEMGRKVESA